MKKLSLIIFVLISLHTFGQSDYEIFQTYADNKEQNKSIANITEMQLQDNGKWKKTAVQQFNFQGLPTMLVQYNTKGEEQEKKIYYYDNNRHLLRVETYKAGKHQGTADFVTNTLGQIISCTEYVYSSLDNEKMFLWKITLEYNQNQSIRKSIRVQGETKQDTVETNLFDTLGVKTKSLWNMAGLRTTKTEFVWSKDKTEMKEHHYEDDTSVYTTTIHKYENGKEINRIDPSTSPKPFHWKYNKSGKIIETNEAFYYVAYYDHDKNGRLKSKTLNVLFSDGPERDLPKKLHFKYIYQMRK